MGSMTNFKKKNIAKKISEMSKEMLQETLKKKKECNAKAQKTVEMMCELQISENWLLDNLQFINQSHYEDVTIERAILKICGYPLCGNQIEKITSQQYHISTRYNKVFDIKERKNFCSNSCYKASEFLKNQLFTSPLWFRDQEVIPKYKLLKTSESSLGKEVIFFPGEIKISDNDLTMKTRLKRQNVNETKEIEKCKVSSTNIEKVLSKNENSNFDVKVKENISLPKEKTNQGRVTDSIVNNENCKLYTSSVTENSHDQTAEKLFCTLTISDSQEKVGGESVVKSNANKVTSKSESGTSQSENSFSNVKKFRNSLPQTRGEHPLVNSVTKVEASIFEWFTLSSLFFLFDEKKLKELFSDKSTEIKEALNTKLKMTINSEKIEKMIKLYTLFGTDNFQSNRTRTDLKPLPDYSALQEESKSIEIKVKAFYQGHLDLKNLKSEKSSQDREETEESNDICLPLIDSQAQSALRRKILLDRLNKVLPELLNLFSTNYILQMGDVRKLVSTFMLTAHNITFKPLEWTLLGIIFIKLLSIKDKQLDTLLKLETSQNHLALILTNYNLEPTYLNKLIEKLISLNNIMDKLD